VICFSFDTDHLDEGRMEEFLELVHVPGRATFFCTQTYRCLEERPHELGPHAFLPPGGDWDAELRSKREAFPEAIGWRSHSCVFSHMLAEQLSELGYRYVSTHDEPGRKHPLPHRQAWGLWHVPIYYMDNLDFSAPRFWPDAPAPFSPEVIESALADDGLYVFGFHPIHLLLNSPDAETYFRLREGWRRGEAIADLRFDGYGTCSFYDDLVAAMDAAGVSTVSIADALAPYLAAAPAAAS
jgi:hypothetical protein